jgi:hypothetical protein
MAMRAVSCSTVSLSDEVITWIQPFITSAIQQLLLSATLNSIRLWRNQH